MAAMAVSVEPPRPHGALIQFLQQADPPCAGLLLRLPFVSHSIPIIRRAWPQPLHQAQHAITASPTSQPRRRRPCVVPVEGQSTEVGHGAYSAFES